MILISHKQLFCNISIMRNEQINILSETKIKAKKDSLGVIINE